MVAVSEHDEATYRRHALLVERALLALTYGDRATAERTMTEILVAGDWWGRCAAAVAWGAVVANSIEPDPSIVGVRRRSVTLVSADTPTRDLEGEPARVAAALIAAVANDDIDGAAAMWRSLTRRVEAEAMGIILRAAASAYGPRAAREARGA